MLVRSRWEVVGWGPQGPQGLQRTVPGTGEEGDDEGRENKGGDGQKGEGGGEGGGGQGGGVGEEGGGEEWMVTYFATTIFTPAGIDVYSRRKEGLGEGTLRAIMEGLKGVDGEAFGKLVEGVFEVVRD
jgi:hypothetical protein